MNIPSILDWNALMPEARAACLRRPAELQDPQRLAAIAEIFKFVRREGDAALRDCTKKFDRAEMKQLEVSTREFENAEAALEPELREALVEACARLETWHAAGMPREFEVETAPGVRCGRVLRGLGRVGLYVPAGSAPLPSTALMLGVPARLAGVGEIVLCTPPRADGSADPLVLAAARLCGGNARVFKLGGAQAIAAMALGTKSVPACDKLFGPGNAWVTAAKQYAAGESNGPAIDMPAGPSEALVVADAGADARRVAADLLSQAEHGPDSQVLLLSDSEELLAKVRDELVVQLRQLPRSAVAAEALGHARLLRVESIAQALEISNAYAPEHLLLALRVPEAWLPAVRRAGSVFLGDEAAEALGDYCSGTNHVLPTGGAARAWSGLSVASFQTAISVQRVDRNGLAAIGPCAMRLARAEGLEAHARAVQFRLEASDVRA
jgi:histidinol dehydrogenase